MGPVFLCTAMFSASYIELPIYLSITSKEELPNVQVNSKIRN